MNEKRSGKTIGIFVDEVAYARYAGLGLRDRKQALAAAKEALLDALAGGEGMPVVKKSFTTETVPPEAVPPVVEAPAVEKPAIPMPVAVAPEVMPVAGETVTDADPALAGFLDAGW